MKTKVLVTGTNSQLGQTIQDLFTVNTESIEFHFLKKSELDITNESDVDKCFSDNKYTYCINCAAYTNVEEAETNSKTAFRINAEGALNIAKSCEKYNTVLIHISTDYVFNGENENPYNENDTTNPINEYGKSKLLGEQHIQHILKDYFIIRTSWLYSKYGKNFVKTIVAKIQENKKLEITTSQIGTPTSSAELSKFIFFLIQSKQKTFGIYHFSAIGEATWYDFAIQISKHFKTSNITSLESFTNKAKRPNYSVLDNRKANEIYSKITNWQKSVDAVVNQLLK